MRRISALLLILLLFVTTLAWALPVPINGDFENADVYSADQWNIDGPWRFRGNENHDGRRAAGIRDYEVLSGDRLTSKSGVVVRNDEIVLTGFYKGHGFIAGMEIVDLLGNVVDIARTDVLDVAEEFTQFTVAWKPSATVAAGPMLWARAFVEATGDAEGIVDGIAFSETALTSLYAAAVSGTPAKSGSKPLPVAATNIAPEISPSGLSSTSGWTASDAGVQAAIETGGFNRPACLVLTGGADDASWTASLDRLDISLPYRVSFDVATDGVSANSTAYAAIMVFDDQIEKVYYAATVPIVPGQQTISAMIPDLQKLPTSAHGQLSLIVPAGFEGQVRFSDVAVVADPHLPTIKAARQQIAVFPDTKSVSFFAQVPNKVDQVTQMVTHIKTINRDGAPVGYEKRAMGVAPRAVALFPASPRPKYNDAYTLIIRVDAADGSHTLAYGEYPFVLSPAQPDDPKNYDFGVVLHGLADEDVLSAATAGAGWIVVPVEYSADAEGRNLAARMRDVKSAARQAQRYGAKLAVQIVFPVGVELTPEGFADFFGTVDWWLGELADAYIVGLNEDNYAAADVTAAAASIQAVVDTISRVQQAGQVADSAILLPAGTQKWLEGVTAAKADAENAVPATDVTPAANTVAVPVEPATAATPVTTALPIAPKPEAIFEVAYQGTLANGGEWLVPVAVPAGEEADAMLAREAAIALSGDAAVVILPNAGDAALLNEAYAATANWSSFWTLCNQLRGKQFAGGAVRDNVQWLRFNSVDGDTIVTWALKGEQAVVLSGDLSDAVKVTMGGQEWPVNTVMGRSKTTLDAQPMYINIPSGANCTIQAAAGDADNQ